jgi:hypothetical protein
VLDDPLSGIFAIVLGLPWTVLLSRLIDAIAPATSGGLLPGLLVVLVGGSLNTLIVFVVTRWLVGRRGRRRAREAR